MLRARGACVPARANFVVKVAITVCIVSCRSAAAVTDGAASTKERGTASSPRRATASSTAASAA